MRLYFSTTWAGWPSTMVGLDFEKNSLLKSLLSRLRRSRSLAALRNALLLLEKDELQKVWLLRKALSQLNPVESMELLLDKLKQTRSNKEFLAAMHSMG